MTSLDLFQKRFAHFLSAPADKNISSPVAPGVLKGISLADRANIYRNNVHVALIDALKATYPAILRLVSNEFFEFAARKYMEEHWPTSPVILHFGSSFPSFLESFEPASSVPYLADVARLERFYVEAFHAPEADPLPGSALDGLPANLETRLVLHPSSRLMTSAFPVSRIWELNRTDQPIKSGTKVGNDAEFLLIVRPMARVEVRRLRKSTYMMMQSLKEGRPLKDAFKAAFDADKDATPETDLRDLARGDTFIDLRENLSR